MTTSVTIVTLAVPLSPATCWSAFSAAPPVTYDFTPGGAWCLLDDVAHGGDGLVGQRLAHVAAQIELNVRGLAVVALRPRRGQRIAPEVRDVLDVGRVGLGTS